MGRLDAGYDSHFEDALLVIWMLVLVRMIMGEMRMVNTHDNLRMLNSQSSSIIASFTIFPKNVFKCINSCSVCSISYSMHIDLNASFKPLILSVKCLITHLYTYFFNHICQLCLVDQHCPTGVDVITVRF